MASRDRLSPIVPTGLQREELKMISRRTVLHGPAFGGLLASLRRRRP